MTIISMASVAWAQGAGAAEGPAGLLSLVPFILIFVIFYFLLILPQQRKQKEHRKMLEALKKGDKVITSSGIWGSITRLDKETATVQIDDNTKVKIQRENISRIRTTDEG
ncbi:preprotein translocase subunit YajC [Candidatus Nitronereus thalassa]|uniref:Sec translocon accessory complex subunit YajC n=1 Tax=Candidatus Nitronereus thalassa TaxID=3020898 RepID=A0ABU3KCP3_9BACT|nr:preprotein translocase subunit YajC [Candidatus Nitronereus thalassa]MDT7044163.1 preprotein translocase subunit YajC [Candidatus Nitronereus thalassa]